MSEELCRRLRRSVSHDAEICDEAAALIDQQAARIAGLEADVERWKAMASFCTSSRAEAAEAEVKRLRETQEEVRNKVLEEAARWIRAQMNGDDSDAYIEGHNDGLNDASKLLSAAPLREELARALATQESRHD